MRLKAGQIFCFVWVMCWAMTQNLLFAQQASLEEYGQNRVQKRTFEWSYYDSTHFRVFYYNNGKFLAQQTVQQAELDLPEILSQMGGSINNKLNIIIYNSYLDFKQTNVGRYNEELKRNNGGVFEVSGENIVVYYNGNHQDLRQQIRYGVANAVKDQMLFGDNLKEVVKNALSNKIAPWFTMGYVNYIAYDWNGDRNAALRSLVSERKRNGKLKTLRFVDYANEKPELVGHSFWNFIAQEYGEDKIKNLIYLVRMHKPIKECIPYIFDLSENEFYKAWKNYYAFPIKDSLPDNKKMNKSEKKELKDLLAKKEFKLDSISGRQFLLSIAPKPGAKLKNFAVSPYGTDIAYCEFINNTYRVILHQVRSNKKTVILEGGIRTSTVANDPLYPLICWSADGNKMAILYEKDYNQLLKIWDGKKGRVYSYAIRANRFDRVSGMKFMDDDEELLMTFIKKGQSDIGMYTLKNGRLTNLNKDVLDDYSPAYVNSTLQQGILFMSNRMFPSLSYNLIKNEYPANESQIYFYNQKIASPSLLKLTDAKDVHLSQPTQFGYDRFAFLMEQDGIKKRFVAFVQKSKLNPNQDSINYYVNAAMPYNILHHEYITKLNAILDVVEYDNRYYAYLTKTAELDSMDKLLLPDTIQVLKSKTDFVKKIDEVKPAVFFLNEFEELPADSTERVIIAPQTARPDAENTTLTDIAKANTLDSSYKKLKAKSYKVTFSPDFIQTSYDNSLLVNKYQPYSWNSNSVFSNPGNNALIKLSLMDVMEDYKITGGIRSPFDFNGLLYFIKFSNFRKFLDWDITYMHNKTKRQYLIGTLPAPYTSFYDEVAKQTTDYLQASLVRPFNFISAAKFQLGLRYDNLSFYQTSENSAALAPASDFWSLARAEYVYDNSSMPYKNITVGTKLKFFVEGATQFSNDKKSYYNFGTDSRYYKNIYKNIISASRFSLTIGGGSGPVLYSLGGVDNQINTNQNPQPLMDTNYLKKYSFQTNATQLRGFAQNVRNGTSFYSLTQEFRIPILNTITRRQSRSDFLNHMQLVLFADGGTAWNGFLFKQLNDYRQFISGNPNVVVIYPSKDNNSFLASYGCGVRTKLLGYYARIDWAWNYFSSTRRWHLSLINDF